MLSLTNTREFRSAPSSFGVLLIALTMLSGCHSRKAAVAPSIQFTRVPQATLSDPDKLDIIQGRVTGARSGQQIVLYVRNGEMLDPAAAERARSLKDQAVCLRHNGHRGCTAKKFDKRLSCKADRVSLDF